MNHVLVSQYSHRYSGSDAVVSTQSRTVGGYPLTVVLYISLDGILFEVEYLVAVLLRHHVHVSLQDHSGMALHTRRSRLTDKHIAYLVLQGLQAQRLAVVNKKVRNLFAFTARTRYLRELVEVLPHSFGFQISHILCFF